MIKILISLFNSFFFFALFWLIFRSWAVAGIVAGVVWITTLFALSLATMSHYPNVPNIKNQPLQTNQDSFQLISQGAGSRDYSLVSTPTSKPNKITGHKEPAYWKNN